MRFMRRQSIVLVASMLLGVTLLACGLLPTEEPARIWTPMPLIIGPDQPSPSAIFLPTTTPGPNPPVSTSTHQAQAFARPTVVTSLPSPTPTRTAVVLPSPTPSLTPAPTATLIPTRPPSPTPGPEVVTITEEAVTQAVAAGAGTQQGVVVEGLTVRFGDGKLRISASRLGYGLLQVRDLVLVGRLVAQDGLLKLEVESVSPQGLVTAMIPTLADQALSQYAAQWYVEEVRTLDGRIELKVR